MHAGLSTEGGVRKAQNKCRDAVRLSKPELGANDSPQYVTSNITFYTENTQVIKQCISRTQQLNENQKCTLAKCQLPLKDHKKLCILSAKS